jgi:DNA-directed RNA polymerase specialized sigma24 family protein
MSARQKESALNQRSFESLLLVLDTDRERAGDRYQAIRAKLIRIFEWHGCGSAEALADKTIDRVGRRIAEGEQIRASDPVVYFCGVARNVLKEYWTDQGKERTARKLGSPWLRLESEEGDFEESEFREQLECLDRCLAKLPRESLKLITRYYGSEKGREIADRARLARTLSITPGTLRIRAHRIRKLLERRVNETMKAQADA